MSGTRSASVWVFPLGNARATGFGRYPSRCATVTTCSRVVAEIRSGEEKARDTVDAATPASRATSWIVMRRATGTPPSDLAHSGNFGNDVQPIAKATPHA